MTARWAAALLLRVAVYVGGLLASCEIPTASAESPGTTAREYCLSYPSGVRPSFEDMTSDDAFTVAIRVSPAARRIALSDQHNRVVVWDAKPHASPIQYPGYGRAQAITDSDGLYLRGPGGPVWRLDLKTGERRISCPACLGPDNIEEVLESGRYVVATRHANPGKNFSEIVILDECLIAKIVATGEGACQPPMLERFLKECGPGAAPGLLPQSCRTEQRPLRIPAGRVMSAQIDRGELYASERQNGVTGVDTVVRSVLDAQEKRRWKQDSRAQIRVSQGRLLEWSASSGAVTIREALTGAIKERVEIFSNLPLNTSCVDLEAFAGQFAVFHRTCEATDGHRWRILDVGTGKIVWRSQKPLAGVGVSPQGDVVVAHRRGICVTPARS